MAQITIKRTNPNDKQDVNIGFEIHKSPDYFKRKLSIDQSSRIAGANTRLTSANTDEFVLSQGEYCIIPMVQYGNVSSNLDFEISVSSPKRVILSLMPPLKELSEWTSISATGVWKKEFKSVRYSF
mgnify:CR=1 FL=1